MISALLWLLLATATSSQDDIFQRNDDMCARSTRCELVDECHCPEDTQPSKATQQFTSNCAPFDSYFRKYADSSGGKDHSPGSYSRMDGKWKSWDGELIISEEYPDDESFNQALCPNKQLVGLKHLFEKHQPYANVTRPSKADMDEWNRIVLQYIRNITGYGDFTVNPSVCYYMQALISAERFNTDLWTCGEYQPNTCKGSGKIHCSDFFLPQWKQNDRPLQKRYLPEGHRTCGQYSGWAAQFAGQDARVPASMFVSGVFCNFLYEEGLSGAHLGPFFLRPNFGFSFVSAAWRMILETSLTLCLRSTILHPRMTRVIS